METQLLKLNPPYNIICSKGRFAKHIATLIVSDMKGSSDSFQWALNSQSYPVVDYGDGSAEGDVWNDTEVKDCKVVLKDPGSSSTLISLAWFSKILEFNLEQFEKYLSPGILFPLLKRFHIMVNLPGPTKYDFPDDLANYDFTQTHKYTYEIPLVFKDHNNEVVIVKSSPDSDFFFFTVIPLNNNESQKGEMMAIHDIMDWWKDYHNYFHGYETKGRKLSIKFLTEDENFKPFVERLNQAIKEDGEQK